MHTTNCGVVVRREVRFRQGAVIDGRARAKALAEEVSADLAGRATLRAYQDMAGFADRVHWMIHLDTLADYAEVIRRLDASDQQARDVLDGSHAEMCMIPQHWGMYGTADAVPAGETVAERREDLLVPPAQLQSAVPADKTLSSDTARLIIHRWAQPVYGLRGEARSFARAVAESINQWSPGVASSFVFENAFGPADRIHWLIHMRGPESYYDMIDMHQRMTPEVAAIYLEERIPAAKGGGTWSRMFLEGSMDEVAFIPL